MGKNIKKSEIEKLIVQGYSTAEIAKKMNYSIGTIRNFYTELREEGNVNSKTEIALRYVAKRFINIKRECEDVLSILPDVSNDT